MYVELHLGQFNTFFNNLQTIFKHDQIGVILTIPIINIFKITIDNLKETFQEGHENKLKIKTPLASFILVSL